MEDLGNIIKENLDCPVCKELPMGHILICERGHSMCSRCRRRIKNCPICKGTLTDIRNICAEKIAANISRTCEFSDYGCPEMLMNCNIALHEESCKFRYHLYFCDSQFRPCRCDLPGSDFLGTQRCNEVEVCSKNTTEHMLKVHNLAGAISNQVQIQYNLTEKEIRKKRFHVSKTDSRFFKCYGCVFLAIVTYDKGDNCANFCLCTSMNVMEKYSEFTKDSFKARISIKNSKRSLEWESAVQDSKKNLSEVFQSGACLSVPFINLVALSNDNLNQQTKPIHIVFSVIKTETSS